MFPYPVSANIPIYPFPCPRTPPLPSIIMEFPVFKHTISDNFVTLDLLFLLLKSYCHSPRLWALSQILTFWLLFAFKTWQFPDLAILWNISLFDDKSSPPLLSWMSKANKDLKLASNNCCLILMAMAMALIGYLYFSFLALTGAQAKEWLFVSFFRAFLVNLEAYLGHSLSDGSNILLLLFKSFQAVPYLNFYTLSCFLFISYY